MLEELLDKICGRDNVWYATNIEIYDYKMAQKQLIISADESIIYNPTQTQACVRHGENINAPLDIITINPGETVKL
jgi:hypothetical protein